MAKAAPPLRVVEPGETAPTKAPETLAEAVAADDRRALLVIMRGKLAAAIDAGVPAHSLVRMLGELEKTDAEIRRIDAAAAGGRQEESSGDAGAGASHSRGRQAFDAASL